MRSLMKGASTKKNLNTEGLVHRLSPSCDGCLNVVVPLAIAAGDL